MKTIAEIVRGMTLAEFTEVENTWWVVSKLLGKSVTRKPSQRAYLNYQENTAWIPLKDCQYADSWSKQVRKWETKHS